MPVSAPRCNDIAPFHVVELFQRAKALEAQGIDVIHMEVGEPDFPTPEPVITAAQRSLAEGKVFYTPSLGLPELRERIAGFYYQRYGLQVPARRIVVTAGASGALTLALACLCAPGSEWLMTDPGYPCNRHFVRAFEGTPVSIPVGPDTNFQPTRELLAQHWTSSTGGLIVASPANPTGAMLDAASLAALAGSVREHNGTLVADEIYHGLCYDSPATSALAAGDDVWIVQSFSKYFCMTGWRLGWLVVPEAFVRDVEKLAQNLFIAPSTPAQYAALAAFSDENLAILEARREEFRLRRDALAPAVEALGFRLTARPQGAFYLYCDSSELTADSDAFCRDLLESAHVAITPGLDFGHNRPQHHVRFAYANSRERLLEAVERMHKYLRGRSAA